MTKPKTKRAPRILFVNKYYRPDTAATAQLLTDLAEHMAASGFDVTVLAGRRPYRGSGRALPCGETINGVRVVRADATAFGRGRMLGRLVDYVSFYLCAFLKAMALPRQDIVVSMTSPPFLHWLGALLCLCRKSRFAVWSMDVYPDVAIALGYVPEGSRLARLLRWINRRALRSADLVVALGDRMAELLEQGGARNEAMEVVHNWADEHIEPVPAEENPFHAEHGLAGKFVVAYSGNVGLGHAFDSMLSAARMLRDQHDIAFLVIGDGPGAAHVRQYIKQYDLRNFVMLSHQPRERLAVTLSAGDVHVVAMRDGLSGMIVPSKLYGIMAAGRAVLYVGPESGDTVPVIAAADCGVALPSDDAQAFVDAVLSLRDDPSRTAALGRNARAHFDGHFTRPLATARLQSLLRALLA